MEQKSYQFVTITINKRKRKHTITYTVIWLVKVEICYAQYKIDKKRHRLNWTYKHTQKYGQHFRHVKKYKA